MPIRGLLEVQEVVFDPEDIKAITAAHETALKRLQIADRKSAMAFLVAKTVIEVAKDGERDPQHLSERVIRLLRDTTLWERLRIAPSLRKERADMAWIVGTVQKISLHKGPSLDRLQRTDEL
jgi:hypothetical protein